MKKFSMILLALLAVAFIAPAAFAQTGAMPGYEGTNWVAITSGFAMAIASAACGIAQACEGLARNPGAAAPIRFALLLSLVLIESMALYTFAIIFAKVK